MGVVDIVVIVVLGVFGLVGASKGFIKSIMGLVAVVAAALVAWLVGGEVAKLIGGISAGEGTLMQNLAGSISGSLAEKGELLTTVPQGGYTLENVTAILQVSGVPNILIGVLANPLTVALAPYGATPIADVLGPILANLVFNAGAFLLVFVVVYSVFLLISKKIARAIKGVGILKSVDVLLGLVLGAVKAALCVWVLLGLVGMLNFMPFFEGIISSSSILTWMSNNNPIVLMLSGGLNLDALIGSVLGGTV